MGDPQRHVEDQSWSFMFLGVLKEMDRSEDLTWEWQEKEGIWVGLPPGMRINDSSLVRRSGIGSTSKGMRPILWFRTQEEWSMLDAYRNMAYGKSCCSPGSVCAGCCA